MKRIGIMLMVLATALLMFAAVGAGTAGAGDKVTFCHAAGPAPTQYISITTDVNGLNGHVDEDTGVFHAEDIIPPGTYTFGGGPNEVTIALPTGQGDQSLLPTCGVTTTTTTFVEPPCEVDCETETTTTVVVPPCEQTEEGCETETTTTTAATTTIPPTTSTPPAETTTTAAPTTDTETESDTTTTTPPANNGGPENPKLDNDGPGKLAFTGVEDIVPLGSIALLMLSLGSGLMWAGRKRDE